MRKIDENRARNYIIKHERYKKWLVFALCISLLTGTATLYMLNKPATAMTQEGAEEVGGVYLETMDAEAEHELIEALYGDSESSENGESEVAAASVSSSTEENTEATENISLSASEDIELTEEEITRLLEEGYTEEEIANLTQEEITGLRTGEITEETDEPLAQKLTTEDLEKLTIDELKKLYKENLTDEEKELVSNELSKKEAEEKLKAELGESEKINLAQDVVLTVSYVDGKGKALADEKEISLSESIDFASEAKVIEGYVFKEAAIDGAAVKCITAKKDDNDHKYYEVELVSGDVVEIKENKTVILTYTSEGAEEEEILTAAESVKLTARYIDNNGEEIQEATELNVTKEIEFNEDFEELIEGYFYEGVFYEENEIAKITPIVEEQASDAETEKEDAEEASDNSDESEDADETSEATEVIVTGYDITTKNGDVISVTEDTEITFKYLKACEETEFSFEDSKITVKIATTRSGVFPEGIQLKVAEVTPESANYNYDAYLNALNENADAIASESGKDGAETFSENNTLMYDIAFIYEDKEIQPKDGSVTVTMEFKDQQLSDGLAAENSEDLAVVHLPIKEEVKEATEIATTEEATDITSEDIKVETLTDASAEVGDEQKVEFISDSFSIFAVISYQDHTPGTDTYRTVLGDAINFGVTADWIKFSESETNFAVKYVDADGQTGNDMTNPEEQTFMAGWIEGGFKVKGEKAYFIVPDSCAGKITHNNVVVFNTSYTTDEINSNVEKMLEYTRNASKDLATRKDNAQIIEKYVDNCRSGIDLRSFDDNGTFYVTIDESNVNLINETQKLYIFKKSGQTLVFNIKCGGNFTLHKFMVSTDGGEPVPSDTLVGTKEDTVARTLIWNFIDVNSVNIDAGAAGVFISGNTNAYWLNNNPTSGWVAFPRVELQAEFHNTYNEVRKIGGTAQFQASKNIDGKPATVSGFEFTLYKQDSSAQDGWSEVEKVRTGNDSESTTKKINQENIDAHAIAFSSIAYGNSNPTGRKNFQYTSATEGNPETFIYKIAETNGTSGDDGTVYTPDKNVYYAKVIVTYRKLTEFSDTIYYDVSEPEYFIDEACKTKISTEVPEFNNTTKSGHVGFTLYKYINGADPTNEVFKFTVRYLKRDGSLATLTDSLENSGSVINYELDFNSSHIAADGNIHFIITENNISDPNYTKDDAYIYVKVSNPGVTGETDQSKNQNLSYYYVPKGAQYYYNCEILEDTQNLRRLNKTYYVQAITNNTTYKVLPEDLVKKAAFQNKATGKLRIHKMVVNVFGEKQVREDQRNAILKNVWFRLTNESTGERIVFKGFVGDAGTEDEARGYTTDGQVNTYRVVYNESAQWTVIGIPYGTYTVEEVGDGFTFTYDEASDTSSLKADATLTRVTKYGVTVDEETGDDTTYGEGGGNRRAVFSVDVTNKTAAIPEEVPVGSDIRTVQVANYYSLPIGPLQVAKHLTGGPWGDNMEFTFDIVGLGCTAKDSEGLHYIDITQPMPEKTSVTVTKADETDGNAVVNFGSVPIRYEGEYRYKITENASNPISGVQYDERAYYVKILVTKKDTTFIKSYTYSKLRLPARDGSTDVTEDFSYLGADIIYYSDENFSKEVTRCTLYLEKNLDTGKDFGNEFIVEYAPGTSVDDVAFTNTLTGELTVVKEWKDKDGGDDSANHTKPLVLQVWQKTTNSNDTWKIYGDPITLTPNDWGKEVKVTNLPLKDEYGNAYVYTVKEGDEYTKTYNVTYTYNGESYLAYERDMVTIDGQSVMDTGYVMTATASGNYGKVVITNKNVFTNKLPSTGGMGTTQFAAIGALLIAIAFAGIMLFRKRRVF